MFHLPFYRFFCISLSFFP